MKYILIACLSIGALIASSATANASVPFDMSSGMVVISVRINDREFRAILDTGANVNAIDTSLTDYVQLDGRSKTLNFSDRGGIQANTGMTKLAIDSRIYTMPFVVTKTKIAKDCCDILLGKPFFDKHAVLFDFDKSTIEISPKRLPKSKQHAFNIRAGEKELLVSCVANGQRTLGRLDLGSQQALDVTGEFAKELKLLESPKTVFLDSALQPGLGLASIDAKCGSLKLDPDIPAVVHPVSKSGLGQGPVGINIGSPYLKRYHWLIDLPRSRMVFFERSSPPPIAYNPLHVFFASEPSGRIFVKSVLAGGFGEELGLKAGDILLSINGVDLKHTEHAYALVEKNPRQILRLNIERDERPLALTGKPTSLFPRKVLFAQSPYGLAHSDSNPASSTSSPLQIESIQFARILYHQIEGDFSLSRSLDGISVRDLLFRQFLTSVTYLKEGSDAVYFDGLKVTRDRKIGAELSMSTPSLAFECKGQSLDVKSSWLADSIFNAVQTIHGCGKTLRIHTTYYLETSKQPSGPIDSANEPFLYLHDSHTGNRARWETKTLTLALDSRAPSWVRELLEESLLEYNTVLNPALKLNFIDKDLSAIPVSSPENFGIYWSDSGHAYDTETRFGQVRLIQNPRTGDIQDADLILRSAEFVQHEKLVQKIASEAAANATTEGKENIERFAKQKIRDQRKNVVIHELGHLLGLAHNFSEKEKSVMSYATITTLSDYDRAALRSLYFGEKPQRSFDLKSEPGPGSGRGFD